MAGLVSERFVAAKVKVLDAPDVAKKYRATWTPTLLWFDADGQEHHREVGYLPAPDFLAHSWYALARADFNNGKHADAREKFLRIVDQYRDTAPAAAAKYWAGVADYRATGTPDGLKKHWLAMREQFPASEWTKKASFLWS